MKSFCFRETLVGRSLWIAAMCLWPVFPVSAAETAEPRKTERSIDWSGSVQAASSYLYRGINLNDGFTLSLSLSARHKSGVFASFWLGEDDIAGVLGDSRDSDIETEYLLGFSKVFNRRWSMSVSSIWHEYLQDSQPRNHDFRETAVQFNHADVGSFAVGHGHDVWTSGMNVTYFYYQHRNAFLVGERVFYGVKELGTNWLTRGSSEMKNIRLDYVRLGVASRFAGNFTLQLDYSYSRPSRSGFFNTSRIRSQPVISLRKSL